MAFFKEKEPEPINNHVERTIIEAKYSIKDLSLKEIKMLKRGLDELWIGKGYPYLGDRSPELAELIAKIQL